MDFQRHYEHRKLAFTQSDRRPDLRARQKRLAREEILRVALELFLLKGYKKTTMQNIAAEAHVGVATVFRNFGTKGAILAALVRRDLDDIFDEGWKIVLNPDPSVADSIQKLIACLLAVIEKPSKGIRASPSLWPAVVVGRPEVDEVVQWADEMTQLQFYGVLHEYEEKYEEKLPFNLVDMAMNIFYIFNGHYIDFLAGNQREPRRMIRDLQRCVGIILP